MSLRDYDWQITYGPADQPLHNFYIPALQRSVRYDRSAGFFSSSALAIAAAGVAGLILNHGRMRLLVGAELSDEDVQAIVKGQAIEAIVEQKLINVLKQPVEEVMQQRWQVLAWMIANGTLEIKVVLPIDQRGLPIPHAVEYFHIKEGIFTDENGDQISFSGSVNESLTAWQRNYEQFSVYRSWEASRPYHMQCVHRFDRLWHNQEADWLAFDIPQAAQQALISYAPSSAPEYDPLDRRRRLINHITEDVEAKLRKERIIFQFLRDVPYLPDNAGLGAATSAVEPWPHQTRVSQRIIESYPRSYMLCDEVGLGKTIEAGLVLRQLIITRTVQRCLLLVPRSVARQWQEELYEKFVLDIPLFDGRHFHNYAGEVLTPQHRDDNPWNHFDIFIATSQLAKRQERHEQLRRANAWDLIMVDEAHHARRKDFLQENYYRPNRLLDLLSDPKVRKRSILLMTATPMQVHPLEVWDLLKVLGLGGRWGADGRNFMDYFTELRYGQGDYANISWDFVFNMVCDYLENGGSLDPQFEQEARISLGPVHWRKVRSLPCSDQATRTVKRLPAPAQDYAYKLAKLHTPLRQFMFRNTRDLLREYVAQGLLDATVPNRSPEPVWISMRPDERELYDRIEEYITQFYRKYEAKRTGLGFVMTVYRRRLTSSFYAVRKSLERRLDFLEGQMQNGGWATDEDLEQEELTADITEELSEMEAEFYAEEAEYVRDFLSELEQLSVYDSKTEQLIDDLGQLFRTHNTVIVFTQYTDTMDYLRAKLLDVYNAQVACYSGRGGELWNGIAWVVVPKEDIKQKFRRGDEVKILLCTEAASEGLNLQTCGVLINYDMPWNPMRVEQRIGRIDRIGQVHNTVYIRNYFYADTIEARVHQALSNRIDWFENVVGHLQPILASVGRMIEKLVMTAPDEREAELEQAIAKLEAEITDSTVKDVLDVYEGTETVQHDNQLATPIALEDIEGFLVQSQHLARVFQPHHEIDDAYILTQASQHVHAVTFKRQVFDTHPNSVQMLSYGSLLFDQILDGIESPGNSEAVGILRLSVEKPLPQVAYYATNPEGEFRQLRTYAELTAALENPTAEWTDAAVKAATADFHELTQQRFRKLKETTETYQRGVTLSLAEQAKEVLKKAALVDIALSQVTGTLQPDIAPLTFGPQAVNGLAKRDTAYKQLLDFLNGHIPTLSPSEPYFQSITGTGSEPLRGEFRRLTNQAQDLLRRLKDHHGNQLTLQDDLDAPRPQFLT